MFVVHTSIRRRESEGDTRRGKLYIKIIFNWTLNITTKSCHYISYPKNIRRRSIKKREYSLMLGKWQYRLPLISFHFEKTICWVIGIGKRNKAMLWKLFSCFEFWVFIYFLYMLRIFLILRLYLYPSYSSHRTWKCTEWNYPTPLYVEAPIKWVHRHYGLGMAAKAEQKNRTEWHTSGIKWIHSNLMILSFIYRRFEYWFCFYFYSFEGLHPQFICMIGEWRSSKFALELSRCD